MAGGSDVLSAWLKGETSPHAPAYQYDMMHDAPRNEAYRTAIAEAVTSEDEFVLEIGTGSGLLAMLAGQTQCQHVFSVEGERTLADAAKHVVEANGMGERITVLQMLSTELRLGWSAANMPCRADVLVAEIFDTSLVGEGVLPSFADAHRRLLAEGARVVPHRGVIFAAGFRSDRLRAMDLLEGRAHEAFTGGPRPSRPRNAEAVPVFQVHGGDLLRRGLVRLVTEPAEVLNLELASPSLLPEPRSLKDLIVTVDGTIDGVLMWWRLDMNVTGSITISTCPLSGDSTAETAPPRAHWQQGAAVFRDAPNCACGDALRLHTHVSGWDLYFALEEDASPQPSKDKVPFAFPAMSRPRLLQLSDERRLMAFSEEVRAHYTPASGPILCLLDGCVGVLAALAASEHVIVLTASDVTADALRMTLSHCDVKEPQLLVVGHCAVDIASEVRFTLQGKTLSLIVCEAYDEGLAVLGNTWGLEEVLLAKQRLHSLLVAGLVDFNLPIVPAMRIAGRGFECTEFRRRRVPVGAVLGFDLRPFNEHAPLWRAHDVKRSSMAAWSPRWITERLEGAVQWHDDIVAVDLCGEVGVGDVHGLVFWVEDCLHLDPLELAFVGLITPLDVHSSCGGDVIVAAFCGGTTPTEGTCRLSFRKP